MSTETHVSTDTPVEIDPIMNRRRRPSFTVQDLCRINGALLLAEKVVRNGELDDLMERITAMVREECVPKHREIVDSYRAAVEVRDGELEMDNDAEVSLGDDPGAYVMVWKWVPAEDAGFYSEEEDE